MQVRWDKMGTYSAGVIFFSMENETNIINWEQDVVHQRIVSAVKRVDFVSERISYDSSESSLV
jgi:hypothetical protein